MELISLLPHCHMDLSLGGEKDRKQQNACVCADVGGLSSYWQKCHPPLINAHRWAALHANQEHLGRFSLSACHPRVYVGHTVNEEIRANLKFSKRIGKDVYFSSPHWMPWPRTILKLGEDITSLRNSIPGFTIGWSLFWIFKLKIWAIDGIFSTWK